MAKRNLTVIVRLTVEETPSGGYSRTVLADCSLQTGGIEVLSDVQDELQRQINEASNGMFASLNNVRDREAAAAKTE